MTNKTICRDDGRCEYAIQAGIEGLAQCQAGKCSMPQPAHLTIPGALEWDGDNGTHGVVGTHGADGESCAHGESAYTAVDMTTAAADGFRDGQAELHAVLNQAYMALIGYLPGHRNDLTDAAIAACSAILFPVEAKAACSRCGGWGHIETEDSAYDCPECGPSVVDRAVEAGVMNAPKPYVAMSEAEADEFLSSFGGGSGNKAKRRIAAIEKAKQKTCIECDQPYCHGVCVERGDQDYDRDQAAKGGCDE